MVCGRDWWQTGYSERLNHLKRRQYANGYIKSMPVSIATSLRSRAQRRSDETDSIISNEYKRRVANWREAPDNLELRKVAA